VAALLLRPPGRRNLHLIRNPGAHCSGTRTWFDSLPYGSEIGALLLVGCLAAGSHEPGPTVPGTYSSHYSCDEARRDELVLTLLPSHVFSLQQVGRNADCGHQLTLVYVGRWQLSDDGRELSLDAGPTWLRRIDVVNRRTFRFPDQPRVEAPVLPTSMLAYRTRLMPFREPFQLTGLTIMVNQPE
jgi:hypothetical protein